MASVSSWWNKSKVAVVRLQGTIASGRGGNRVNLENVSKSLNKAFGNKRRRPQAVALIINSPGGSAAQSSIIAKRIKQLKKEAGVPVYAFVEDVAASGGYYIACAADKIYVDENSVVGSIGVVGSSFGLDKWIAKHNIERRVYAAGKHKVMLDAFQPEDPEERAMLQEKLEFIAETFKNVVKDARGSKLDLEEEKLFEGEWWVGTKAIEVGLADEVGDMYSVMTEKFGSDIKFMETKTNPWAHAFGAKSSMAGITAEAIHEAFADVSAKVEDAHLWTAAGVTHTHH